VPACRCQVARRRHQEKQCTQDAAENQLLPFFGKGHGGKPSFWKSSCCGIDKKKPFRNSRLQLLIIQHLKGIEGGHFRPQAHEFIQIPVPYQGAEPQVLPGIMFLPDFLHRQEGDIPPGIKGAAELFIGEIVCPMLDLSTIAQMRNGPPSLPGKDKGSSPFKEVGLTAAPTFVNRDIRPFQGRGTVAPRRNGGGFALRSL
jgi:hypothetical protein